MSCSAPKFTKEEYQWHLDDQPAPKRQTRSGGGQASDFIKKFGRWLRRHDPAAFNAGFVKWVASKSKEAA